MRSAFKRSLMVLLLMAFSFVSAAGVHCAHAPVRSIKTHNSHCDLADLAKIDLAKSDDGGGKQDGGRQNACCLICGAGCADLAMTPTAATASTPAATGSYAALHSSAAESPSPQRAERANPARAPPSLT